MRWSDAVLDAHILAIETPRPPDGRWHPSSLFGCARQAVYEQRGVPNSDERESRARRILRLGTTVHGIVQEAYANESGAQTVYNEVAVTIPPLNVTGHCDTLLEYAPEHDYIHIGDEGPFDCDECGGDRDDERHGFYELLEFKSIGSKGLNYLDGPKSEHEKQARTYMYGLRKYGGEVDGTACPIPDCLDGIEHAAHTPPLGDKLKRGRVAYFSRDDLRIVEFTFTHDPEWDEWFVNYVTGLAALDGNALPPRLPLERGKKNWLCAGYCLYRTRCWGADTEDGLVNEEAV